MLRRLRIQQFGLIRNAELNFRPGANIITGETGSGKSVLLHALSLVLGARSESHLWEKGNSKSTIEAEFDNHPKVLEFLKQQELDSDELLVLRRELPSSGKTRAFINHTPVSVAQLKSMGLLLLRIHSQHETLDLLDKEQEYLLTDALLDKKELPLAYRRLFQEWTSIKNLLGNLKQEQAERVAREEFVRFQLEELERAAIDDPHEADKLEQEQLLLENTQNISEKLFRAEASLRQDGGQLTAFSLLIQDFRPMARFSPELEDLFKRLESQYLELKDIADTVSSMQEDFVLNEERLLHLRDRLDLLNRLMRKHGLHSVEQLIATRIKLEQELQKAEDSGQEIQKKELWCNEAEQQLKSYCTEILKERILAGSKLQEAVNKLLPAAALKDAVFRLVMDQDSQLTSYPACGTRSSWLFSANPGYSPRQLKETASGGELSRLMLCIQMAVSGNLSHQPVMVFDEIDSGISGEAALKVSEMLRSMSSDAQLICVTHLPQTARIADNHILVYKNLDESGKMITECRTLSEEEHEQQLAVMIAGENVSDKAVKTVKELIKNK